MGAEGAKNWSSVCDFTFYVQFYLTASKTLFQTEGRDSPEVTWYTFHVRLLMGLSVNPSKEALPDCPMKVFPDLKLWIKFSFIL